MLTATRSATGAAIAICALLLAFFVSPSSAFAASGGGNCDLDGNCSIHIGGDGSSGSGSSSKGDGSSSGGKTTSSGGKSTCKNDGKTIPCTTSDGSWDSSSNCYMKLADDQSDTPPAGASDTGAWYTCTPICENDPGFERDCYGTTGWQDTPPAAVNTLTPAQAAAELVKRFQLKSIDIGLAPDPDTAGSKSYVGVPIWMWVKDPQPLTWGPYSQTATLGGVTITARAQVTSVLWSMGDGHTVACGSKGTAYETSMGLADSPTCGYKYAKTSKSQPGGRYTITATSQWTVTWSGDGQTGTIPLTKTSTSSAEIGELQSVTTKG